MPSFCAAQDAARNQAANPFAEMQEKYPGLMQEFGQLLQTMQRDIQPPLARTQSHILPLLPEQTVFYLAIPNYGDASHKALAIFQARLKESQALRDWWHQGEMAANGPRIESSIEQFYQLSQYLGEEIVFAASVENLPGTKSEPNFLVLANVRKPGLKNFLLQTVKDAAAESGASVRVLDDQELTNAKASNSPEKFVILVRPDLVIAARDVAALRSFRAGLERKSPGLASTPFGQRVRQAYDAGTTVVAAGNLQAILSHVPLDKAPNQAAFQRSGFADTKYLIWEYRNVPSQPASQMELSFTGPRHGIASWLAAPARLGSLDFVSAKPAMSATVLLKDPAQIFDDIRDLATSSNPNALASLSQMEQAMKVSLKDDLLRTLGGEITFELEKITPPDITWKAILKVRDPERLQATLNTLLATAPVAPRQYDRNGVQYHVLRLPARDKVMEIGYALVDGYLVIASSPETLSQAIHVHRSGTSLARSSKFQASVPPGYSSEASAVFYQDAVAMSALSLSRFAPGMSESFAQASESAPANVTWVYGEDTAIRQVGTGAGSGVTLPLIVGAIAIPNLLRARLSANDASAVSMIRTIVTAQIMYSSAFPMRGYARSLAALGPDPAGSNNSTPAHASLIDATLGNPTCIAGSWCEKSGFRFTMQGACKMARCTDFVVIGTPVSAGTGTRSFCATSDGVVRFRMGQPLSEAITVAECKYWQPVQ